MNTTNSTQGSTEQHNAIVTAPGGAVIFDEQNSTNAYRLIFGEVLILRNGQTIDLVQAGELLDASIWENATAVAWTYCILRKVETQQNAQTVSTNPILIERQLRKTATAVN